MDYSDNLNISYGKNNIKVLQAGATPHRIQIENLGEEDALGRAKIAFDVL